MNILIAAMLSMTPVGELRAGIPYALASGSPAWLALLVCVLTNILVIPIVFFFLSVIHKRLVNTKSYRSAFDYFMERTRRRTHAKVEKYGYAGLFFLTAIPLPFTGAYTASLAAWFFGMKKAKAFFAISLGVLAAGLLMLSVSYGGLSLFGFI
ncbi:small multi-drug export protein [Candidatus Woesearchaeota archaeon]|nr:small multi-drug export protein [Candidatus Woesearchaeota archaeon]